MNDKIHCVITDFGQSEMKSEAFRMSGGKKSSKFVHMCEASNLSLNRRNTAMASAGNDARSLTTLN